MSTLAAAYRRLPEDVRRCLRPLNLADELASFLPVMLRAGAVDAIDMTRRLLQLRRVRVPVRELRGPVAPGGPLLRCLVAADELSTRWWRATLFADPPHERVLDALPARAVSRAAAAGAEGGMDLAVWQLPWPFARAVRRAVLVPSWSPLWLPVEGGLEAAVHGQRSGRAARKNDLRRVRRLGLVTRVGDAVDLARFAAELYTPHVARRFGALGVPQPLHALRRAHRRGWLLLLERDGRAHAGVVLERAREALRIVAFGATSQAAADGAIEACYCEAISWAARLGYRRLALGATRPVLTDGVLRYKRKWGGRLEPPTTRDRFAVRYRNTEAVRAALTAAPLVVEQAPGVLAALVGAEGVDPSEQVGRTDVPGLTALALLVAGRPERRPAAPYTPVRLVRAPEVWPPAAAFVAAV